MRIVNTLGLFLTLAVALALLGSPRQASAEPIGFIAVVQGDVSVSAGGSGTFEAATVDRDVEIGDLIRTGRDSMAKILLADDTTLTIGDETEFQIDEYVLGPEATREVSKISLLSGQMRTAVGEAFGGPTRLELHTPTAVIGVKGTTYECKVETVGGEPHTTCCTLSGVIFMANVDPNVGGSLEAPVGECAQVLPAKVPEFADDFQLLGAVRTAIVIGGDVIIPDLPPVGEGPDGPDELPEDPGTEEPFDPGSNPGVEEPEPRGPDFGGDVIIPEPPIGGDVIIPEAPIGGDIVIN